MKVVNKYKHIKTTDDVYIGRGSVFGNPFKISDSMSRDQVCDAHMEWLQSDDSDAIRARASIDAGDLDGKNLVCFCAPHRCHGENLIEYRSKSK